MSISDNITRLTTARDALTTAIASKGVEVPDDAGFEAFAALVESIEIGDGGINALIEGSLTEFSSDATTIRQYAFCKCTALTAVTCPNAANVGSYAFFGCTALTLTNDSLPNVTTIGEVGLSGVFADSLSFECITTLGASAFNGSKIKDIRLPNLTTVNVRTFRDCTALTNVYVPKLTILYGEDFQRCTALTHICLPSLASFRTGQSTSCFDGCTSLAALILPGAVVPYLSQALSLPDSTILYVPASLLDTYATDTNWTALQDKMAAIEDSEDILQWLSDNGYEYGGTA